MSGLWAGRLGHCGRGVRIAETAEITRPERVSLGDGVVIDPYVHLDATYGKGIFLEPRVAIRRGVVIHSSGSEFPDGCVAIGAGTIIGLRGIVTGHAGTVIGQHVLIGPNVMINGYEHVFDDPDTPICQQGGRARPVLVGDDVYIGIGAVVLGVAVAGGAVIGAGAVVTDNVPARAVVAGNPARIIGYRGGAPANAGPPEGPA